MRICLAVLILTLASAKAFAASIYQNELTLIATGHPSSAYAQLRPKLLASAGNPDFDTAFGLAALDSGAPAEAITAFERVLALDPSNAPVRTELARAYAELGDPAAAKRELDNVRNNPQTPSEVRNNISHYITVLDEALSGGPRAIHATITASTGYDSNINTATTANQLVVPALAALGPARIEAGSQAKESAYTEVGATATITQPLTLSRAVFATISANEKTPFATSDYEQTTLGAEGGIQLRNPEGDKVTLGISGQQFWFGGSSYSTTLAASANWQHPLTQTTNLTTYATASHVEYDSAMPATNRLLAGAMLDTRQTFIIPTYYFAGAYAGTEEAAGTAADYASNTIFGAQAGFEAYPRPDLSLFADIRYENRSYDADYPMFLTAREDNQLDITTGLSYALTSNLLLRPTVSYRDASSNVGFYDYTRWLANIGLRYTL